MPTWRPGDRVKLVEKQDKDQIRWGSNDDPNNLVEIGKTYILESVDVHSWHTKITLEGIKGRFNSVNFELAD